MSDHLTPATNGLPPRQIRRMKFFRVTDAASMQETMLRPSIPADANGTVSSFEQGGPATDTPPRLARQGLAEERATQQGTRNAEGASFNRVWIPGTTGFNDRPPSLPHTFQKHETFPMMILRGVSTQQGQSTPVMDSEISGAAGSAAIVGVGTIVGNVARYGNNFLIQRAFGRGPYGLYTICLSIVVLVSSIFNLGLDDAMIRYVAIYRGKKQPHLLRGLTIFCSSIIGVTGFIGAFVVLFLAPSLAALKHAPAVLPLLQMMIPFIPLTCMQVVWSAGLQGFKAFKWSVLTQRMIIPILMFVLLAIVVVFFRSLFLNGVVIVLLISTSIGAIASCISSSKCSTELIVCVLVDMNCVNGSALRLLTFSHLLLISCLNRQIHSCWRFLLSATLQLVNMPLLSGSAFLLLSHCRRSMLCLLLPSLSFTERVKSKN